MSPTRNPLVILCESPGPNVLAAVVCAEAEVTAGAIARIARTSERWSIFMRVVRGGRCALSDTETGQSAGTPGKIRSFSSVRVSLQSPTAKWGAVTT